jgi:hypothetical protein
MPNVVYLINKGINKSVEFKGLKAQYIWYLGSVVIGGLILFAILYISGVSGYLCVPLILGLGAAGVVRVYRMSHRYGEYGLMKKRAQGNIPRVLHARSRDLFRKP